RRKVARIDTPVAAEVRRRKWRKCTKFSASSVGGYKTGKKENAARGCVRHFELRPYRLAAGAVEIESNTAEPTKPEQGGGRGVVGCSGKKQQRTGPGWNWRFGA